MKYLTMLLVLQSNSNITSLLRQQQKGRYIGVGRYFWTTSFGLKMTCVCILYIYTTIYIVVMYTIPDLHTKTQGIAKGHWLFLEKICDFCFCFLLFLLQRKPFSWRHLAFIDLNKVFFRLVWGACFAN